jgi:hypothetical protein
MASQEASQTCVKKSHQSHFFFCRIAPMAGTKIMPQTRNSLAFLLAIG